MKKIRKTLAICLTASVLAVSSAVSASAVAFKDVSGHWAETTINRWVSLGYINGYPDGTFRPKESITRTEFAVVANNAFNYQNKQAIYFPDVATTFWGYAEIQKAYAAGYMRGDTNGTFRPKANVTRQEAAVMLANIKGLAVGGSAPYYSDSGSISSWARGSVNAVTAAGYMSGYPDGSFRPKSQISRAEVVTMLNKALGGGGGNTYVPPTQSTTDSVQNMTLSNTTLRNTIVNGDLTIPSSMSSRSITLDNVTVRGKLNVEGGGTITAEDCVINELVMDKSSAVFRAEDGTSVAKTTFRANGTLEGNRFQDVSIANSKVNTVTIDAEVENLTLDTDADMRLYGGAEIETFEITKNADDALIELSKGSRVRNMNIRDGVRIAGKGDIDNMTVYVSGVRSEIEPDSLSRKNGANKPDFNWEYDGKRHESSGSGSSSSSGSNKTISKDFDGDGETYKNVTVTDDADIEDMHVTGNLTIDESVENGTVSLEDIRVDGNVYVYGGGGHSVIFKDCDIRGDIISDKDSKASKSQVVALRFDGQTKVRGEIRILNHTILDVYSGSPELSRVVVEERDVELEVDIDIDTLTLEKRAEVDVKNGVTIDTLKINRGIGESTIDMDGSSVIKTVDARSDVDIRGTGTVNTINKDSGVDVSLGSGIKNEPETPSKPGSVTSVKLDKTTTDVEIGKEIKLTATVTAPDDKTDKTVTWSSSDEKIATVSADGVVKGIAVGGPVTITATAKADNTKTATCQVTVAKEGGLEEPDKPDTPLTEPRINPAVVSLQKNGSTTLTVEIPENYKVWQTVEWASSSDSVFLNDDPDTTDKLVKRITGTAVGTAQVTATLKDENGVVLAEPVCDVTVTASEGTSKLTGVNIGKDETGPVVGKLNVKVGTNQTQLAAMLEPSNASFSVLRWSSSNPSVVDPNLKELTTGTRTYLNAKKTGKATITLTAIPSEPAAGETGFTATCEVEVTPDGATVLADSVTVEPATLSLEKEQSSTLRATVSPNNVTDPTVTWTSDKTEVATVDQNGKVKAVGVGNATITAAAAGEKGLVEGTCNVTVTEKNPVNVTDVTLNPATLTLSVGGEPGTLTATVLPANADNKKVSWAISNGGDVIEISSTGNTCTVTPKKEGSAQVTVTTEDGNITKTCDVTVTSDTVTITLSDTTKEIEMLPTGEETLTANVMPAGTPVTWTTSNEDVATVVDGKITAVYPGVTTITATAGSATAECKVTIKPGLEYTYNPGNATPQAEPGGEINFSVKVKPFDAALDYGIVDKEGHAVWGDNLVETDIDESTGTGTSTLTIPDDATADGYVLTITAAPQGATGDALKTEITIDFTVTEKTSGDTTVTGITLDNPSLTMEVDGPNYPPEEQKVRLTATVEPEGATNKEVEWVVATGGDVIGISPSGNSCEVTPKKPGTARITVTSKADNSKAASCDVTVDGLVVNEKSITLKAGAGHQLTTTMRPDTKMVKWESDTQDEGFVVASVDQNGLVTAVKEGTANITVTTTDLKYRDTCEVTVEPDGTETEVTAVTIDGAKDYEMAAGNKLKLTAKVEPENAAGKTVTWSTSADNIAMVNGTGEVTAVGVGTAQVIAAAGGGLSEAVQIAVSPKVEITSQTAAKVKPEEKIEFTYDVKGFGDDLTAVSGLTIKAELRDAKGGSKVILEWNTNEQGTEWENKDDVKKVEASEKTPGEYSLYITATKKETVGSGVYTGTASAKFEVEADSSSDEPDEPDSIAPASQNTVVQSQPAPPRTFSFIPQREIQSKPAAPAVTVEPEQKQEPEKEPEKVQEPVKEPVKEPEKVQEPEKEPVKEPEKVQEPEKEPETQEPEQKQGIALTCADSFKAGETLTLSGTVNGVSSAMRKIDWSIRDAGATGAAIRDGVMSAEQAGTVTIAATVQNSTTTEYFTITVLPGEPKNDAPETQEPEQTPTEPQEPAEDGQPNAPAEPVTPVAPVEPDGQTPVVTPPVVQIGTVTLPNGQVITNAKKYQRNVGAAIALSGLDALPANAAADSVVWKVESFGMTGAALQALDNTLVNVNAKGVILLSRTVRVTDANGNAAVSTTYYEITIA